MLERLEQIAEQPYGAHTKRLANAEGRRAARVGAYRIIFSVNEEQRTVDVASIGPRGQVYRDLT
jgi:mRNA-degrading endonuclease RelE of RelBE toxin-antitoxin system